MSYTKDKWRIHKPANCPYTIHTGEYGSGITKVAVIDEAYPNAEANAQLITAAPELYEALEECVSYFREEIVSKYMEDGTIPYFEGYKKGVKALAKAERK